MSLPRLARRRSLARRTLAALAGGALAVAAGCAGRQAGSATPSTTPSDPPTSPAPSPPPAIPALFAAEGVPPGWVVRGWSDVSQPAAPGALWRVEQGVLKGSIPRGTWLVSEAEYGDFSLEFEFRLGERGNSGVGLRFPPAGDPAFDGIELQLVDPRYYGTNYTGQPWEYTGALYKAAAPSAQLYRPLDWNLCSIVCQGPHVTVRLNAQEVLSVNLDERTEPLERGKPLAQRPRRGRIGFQELSRGGGQVEFRNARLRVLD